MKHRRAPLLQLILPFVPGQQFSRAARTGAHTSQYFSCEQNPQSLGKKHPTHFKTPVNLYRTRGQEKKGGGGEGEKASLDMYSWKFSFQSLKLEGRLHSFLPGLINLSENKYFSSKTTTARPRTGRLLYVPVWLVEKFKHLHQREKKKKKILLESTKRREGKSFYYIRQTFKVAKCSGCRWLLTSRKELDESDFEECRNIRAKW